MGGFYVKWSVVPSIRSHKWKGSITSAFKVWSRNIEEQLEMQRRKSQLNKVVPNHWDSWKSESPTRLIIFTNLPVFPNQVGNIGKLAKIKEKTQIFPTVMESSKCFASGGILLECFLGLLNFYALHYPPNGISFKQKNSFFPPVEFQRLIASIQHTVKLLWQHILV